MVISFEEKEGSVPFGSGAQNLTQEDGVVAAFVAVGYLALNGPYDTVKKRRAILSHAPWDSFKLFYSLGGEATRQFLLVFVQDIDSENL